MPEACGRVRLKEPLTYRPAVELAQGVPLEVGGRGLRDRRPLSPPLGEVDRSDGSPVVGGEVHRLKSAGDRLDVRGDRARAATGGAPVIAEVR